MAEDLWQAWANAALNPRRNLDYHKDDHSNRPLDQGRLRRRQDEGRVR
jgi:hypothetical protein